MKKIFGLLILTLGISMSLHAENLYVDNASPCTAGTACAGTSWATAWKSFSDIRWGSSSSQVGAGDTLFISGGSTSKTYTSGLAIQASGTSDTNRITIRPGQDAGHNGVVIFDFSASGNSATATVFEASQRNYITISGHYNGQNHFKIQNLVNNINEFVGTGVYAFGASQSNPMTGLIVEYVDMYNINNGMRLAYITKSHVRYCNIIRVKGDVGIELASLANVNTWDDSSIHDCVVDVLRNTARPPGQSEPYNGADGLQTHSGISIYNNTIRVSSPTSNTEYTSKQHPDGIQATGRYIKIYNNEFVNIGDSGVNYGTSSSGALFSDVHIFNNTFRIETTIDTLPEFIRLYASTGYGGGTASVSAINNIKILNNTFIDNNHSGNCDAANSGESYCPVQIVDFGPANNPGSNQPPASGNEIRNNIFVNNGNGSAGGPVIKISPSTSFTSNSFVFSNNTYSAGSYIKYNGVTTSAANWVAAGGKEAGTGKVGTPAFVRYTARANNNDLHLQSTDSLARNAGVALSYYSTDKDGVSRPQGAAWDIGAFEVGGTGSVNTPHPADTNADFLMALNEATTFGACWKSNCNASATLDNAVRAGTLWSATANGQYQYNSTNACPACWEIKP